MANQRRTFLSISWIGLTPLCLAPAAAQGIVDPPSLKPAALTAGVATVITARARVIGVAGHAALEKGVNLLQSDENGNNTRVLATLHDDGLNGDVTAVDGVFSGTVLLSPNAPQNIYLRVSAAFSGSLRRILSPLVKVVVTDGSVPNTPHPMDASRTVTDLSSGTSVVCNELLIVFQPGITPSAGKAIVSAAGATLIGMLPALDVYQASVPTCAADSLSNVRSMLLANPSV